jgi:hypothetical protein
VFVVRIWGVECREELILNVTVFVVRVWGGEYREELILNVTVFVARVWAVGNIGTLRSVTVNCDPTPPP